MIELVFVFLWYNAFVDIEALRQIIEGGDSGDSIGGAVCSVSRRPLICGPDALVAVRRVIDRLESEWHAGLHECIADGSIETGLGLSATEWVASSLRVTSREAGSMVRFATRLARTSEVADGLADGTLSLGQAKVIAAACTERAADLFADYEPVIMRTAAGLSTDDLARVVRMWSRHADEATAATDDKEAEARREVFLSPVGEQQWALNGTLSAEQGAVVHEALQAAMEQDSDGADEQRTPRQRRADALETIAREWLEHQATVRLHGVRPHLIVHVDLDNFAAGVNGAGGATSSGVILDGATIERLACDSTIQRIMRGGPLKLDFAHHTVEIPTALRRAVIARDVHCRFAGCCRPASWSEVHHVHGRGGGHRVTELVLLCKRHHQRVHRLKLRLELEPDGTLHIHAPDGTVQTTRPPPTGKLPRRLTADTQTDAALAAWRAESMRDAIAAMSAAANLTVDDHTIAEAARRRTAALRELRFAA